MSIYLRFIVVVVVVLVGSGQKFHYHFLLRIGFEACLSMLPNHNGRDGSQNKQAGHGPCGFDLYILKVLYEVDVGPP